jgi:hypothetical protein
MSDLRDRLQEITDNGEPQTHRELLRELGRELPHTIEIVKGPAQDSRYTCAMHAFDLIEDAEYIAIVMAAPRDVFASPRFVERLIAQGHLVESGGPRQGGLVVYFSNGKVEHIGRLLGEARVESKWGIGHLYHHGLLEVPTKYGSVTRFFEAINRDLALDQYVEYAKENGVRFRGDA